MAIPDKVVVVTKRTPLQELTDRFGTKAQAKFYIQQAVGSPGTELEFAL